MYLAFLLSCALSFFCLPEDNTVLLVLGTGAKLSVLHHHSIPSLPAISFLFSFALSPVSSFSNFRYQWLLYDIRMLLLFNLLLTISCFPLARSLICLWCLSFRDCSHGFPYWLFLCHCNRFYLPVNWVPSFAPAPLSLRCLSYIIPFSTCFVPFVYLQNFKKHLFFKKKIESYLNFFLKICIFY